MSEPLALSRVSLVEDSSGKLTEDTSAKTAAFFCRRLPVLIDAEVVTQLKEVSRQRNNSNVRICLHDGPDATHHDMVALEWGQRYYRPHKHARKGDTFHLIEGRLGIFGFDIEGNVTDAVIIGPGEIYRTAVNVFHAILPLTQFVIHHESKPGPFEKENDSIFPEWAPDGSDPKEVEDYVAELRSFLP